MQGNPRQALRQTPTAPGLLARLQDPAHSSRRTCKPHRRNTGDARVHYAPKMRVHTDCLPLGRPWASRGGTLSPTPGRSSTEPGVGLGHGGVMGAMRVCSTHGCPTQHTNVGKCPACRADAEAIRRPGGSPYATRGHRLGFRAPVLARHPYCQCTGQCGKHDGMCAERSTVADHYPTERVDLITQGLDPNNPQYGRGLCTPCHNAKTAATKPGGWNARD